MDPAAAPVPPPKPQQAAGAQGAATTGGPPPVPPPRPDTSFPNQDEYQQSQQGTTTSQGPASRRRPAPPDPSEQWLPDALKDKTTLQLQPLLTNPPLLTALASSHPSIHPSPLPPYLSSTTLLATHTLSQYNLLLSLRSRVESHLLHLHSLERAWRTKQAELDKELEPWGPKHLYQRLRMAEREAEEESRRLEEEWLEGGGGGGREDGRVGGEREVGEWVKRYKEGRRKVGRRREGRERWDEGRVGGWR